VETGLRDVEQAMLACRAERPEALSLRECGAMGIWADDSGSGQFLQLEHDLEVTLHCSGLCKSFQVPAFAGDLPLSQQKELPACWPLLMFTAGEVGGRLSSLLACVAAPVFLLLAVGMIDPLHLCPEGRASAEIGADESESGEELTCWRRNARDQGGSYAPVLGARNGA